MLHFLFKLRYFVFLFLTFVIFINLSSYKILNPFNTLWLMEGDSATHFIAWQFFRFTPIFQWPIGSNPFYGMEISNSIVFADSVTLIAIILKI